MFSAFGADDLVYTGHEIGSREHVDIEGLINRFPQAVSNPSETLFVDCLY